MSKTLLRIAGEELDAVDILSLYFIDPSEHLMRGPEYNLGLKEFEPEEEPGEYSTSNHRNDRDIGE